VSVKDRWVGPREQVLNVPIACSDMGPINLVVGRRQELGLRPLLHWLAWERSWVWTRGSISRHVVDYVRSHFSQEQRDLSKSIGVSRKVATYGDRHKKRTSGVRGLAWEAYVLCWSNFPLQDVH
jgi:hypothetical protein